MRDVTGKIRRDQTIQGLLKAPINPTKFQIKWILSSGHWELFKEGFGAKVEPDQIFPSMSNVKYGSETDDSENLNAAQEGAGMIWMTGEGGLNRPQERGRGAEEWVDLRDI